jgi:hypothetical protein
MEAAVYYRSFDEHYEISGCCVRNISRGGGRWAVQWAVGGGQRDQRSVACSRGVDVYWH